MTELVRFLSDNWTVLQSAPGAFVLFGVLAFTLALPVATWRYEGIVEQLREQLKSKEEQLKSKDERLRGKDEQLNDYRQRLHLLPATETSYSALSNSQLQQRVFNLVAEVRSFLTGCRSRDDETFFSQWSSRSQLTEEQKHEAWVKQTNTLRRDFLNANDEYDRRFKSETILLRDELLTRLPRSMRNEHEHHSYERPTNLIGMGIVADGLERMAKMLPSESYRTGVQ